MKRLGRLTLTTIAAALCFGATARTKGSPPLLRARYVITTANDIVIDVYHNGKLVPDSKRHMVEERFGATVERIDVDVMKGDWLVFNVVNNRLRWGGAYYFEAAGCFVNDEFGFVSNLEDGNWSACDSPRDVDRFISDRNFLKHRAAQGVSHPWHEKDDWMRTFAGKRWSGAPLWGTSRNTWVKVVVE